MVVDPLGLPVARVIRIVTGWEIDPKDVGLIVPMLAPTGLILLGAVLAAFGAAGMRVQPEFDLSLTGRAAGHVKAARFAAAWQKAYGRVPSAVELANGASEAQAQAKLGQCTVASSTSRIPRSTALRIDVCRRSAGCVASQLSNCQAIRKRESER